MNEVGSDRDNYTKEWKPTSNVPCRLQFPELRQNADSTAE
jgi:hypothetical protein